MKKLGLVAMLCGAVLAANAVPARRGWQTKTQADGSTIEVQLTGDEFYHYWETRNGKVAVEQEDGTFVVADEEKPTVEQFAQRRKAAKRYGNRAKKIGSESMPARALFILVSFDNLAFKDASATYYQSKLGDTTEGAMSMYNYLKEQSNGQYAPPVDVYGPVTVSKAYSYYGENDSEGYDLHPAEMVVEACKALDDRIDFSQYDNNQDGYVDNVYVIYAGKGEADGGSENTIWPHQWNIKSDEGLYCKLDGKEIYTYACSAELNGRNKNAMGTPLHEFGHVIGLPDYYDTEYKSTNYTESRTPGEWSIMDQGSYNNDGNTPPNYSIYDKYYLGWATPKVLAKDDQRNVTLTTAYGDAYQINGGTSLLAATNTKTIYYIENRQKSGWDAYLPGHGMIVWQVKYNASEWEENVLNNTGGSPRFTLVSASGSPKNIGKASDPFPGTGNVKSYTPFTGCALTEITETSGTITFKYNGGEQKEVHVTFMANGTEWANATSTGTLVLPENDPDACLGKVFVGWTATADYSSETTAPTLAKAGDPLTQDTTFYAVYAEQSGEGGETAFDGQNGGVFKIYAQAGDTKYYATATVSNNKLQSTTDEAAAAEFTIETVTGGWTIKNNGKYLAYTGTKSAKTNVGLKDAAYTWTLAGGTNGTWRLNSATDDGRALVFRAGEYKVFAGYATSNISAGGTEYYDLEIGGGSAPSYANYTTSCSGEATANHTVKTTTKARKVVENGQVFILRDGIRYNVLGQQVR